MIPKIKMFVNEHKDEVKTVATTAAIVSVIAVIVYKAKTSNMITFNEVNAIIQEEFDYVRENHPDFMTNKNMYLRIGKE